MMQLPWTKNSSIKIAIIGDVMLDEYLEGDVSRISPEAPVPVHHVKKVIFVPGGAANTARNVSKAGGQVKLFSVCGADEAGNNLIKMLEADHVESSGVIRSPFRPTIRKTRVTSANQQMLRIDWEKIEAINQEEQAQLLEMLYSSTFDLLVISDYAKGILPQDFLIKLFSLAKAKNVTTVVDPKGKDFTRYQGASIITPNLKEAREALGLDISEPSIKGEELGRKLQDKYSLADILVTMGGEGMVYVPKNRDLSPIHKKPHSLEVFDVSGAGDTVVGIMALSLAAKAPIADCLMLANLAAGLVVQKWGTQPILQAELEHALQSQASSPKAWQGGGGKIKELSELKAIVASYKADGLKVVFTNGCFDLLHAGHVSYLEEARALGDVLVVGVNTDNSIQRLKGPARPLVPLANRMKVLSGLGCIDFLVSFDEDTPLETISALIPNILAKGADYQEHQIVGGDVVKAHGGVVRRIPLVEGLSTTNIISKMK